MNNMLSEVVYGHIGLQLLQNPHFASLKAANNTNEAEFDFVCSHFALNSRYSHAPPPPAAQVTSLLHFGCLFVSCYFIRFYIL